MKKQSLLLITFVFIGLNSFSQELTCADFKTGNFYIPASTEGLKKYSVVSKDSINTKSKEFAIEREEDIKKYVVIRESGTQIEWKNGINNGAPEYEIIEWLDDCSYRLKYDAEKTELTDQKKWVNENNGIVVSKVRIIDNCMDYVATMTTNDGRKISQQGTICKE